ncbi:hypothetical protein FACS1894211_16360 [Clostridia bacterium]|nr:hypothetical protein FACS1894211_16360 [Clostridia bacterium]
MKRLNKISFILLLAASVVLFAFELTDTVLFVSAIRGSMTQPESASDATLVGGGFVWLFDTVLGGAAIVVRIVLFVLRGPALTGFIAAKACDHRKRARLGAAWLWCLLVLVGILFFWDLFGGSHLSVLEDGVVHIFRFIGYGLLAAAIILQFAWPKTAPPPPSTGNRY